MMPIVVVTDTVTVFRPQNFSIAWEYAGHLAFMGFPFP